MAAAPPQPDRAAEPARGGTGGLRLQLRRAQAEAGDIVLLCGDESEALTPGAFAARNADPTSPMPGPSGARTCGCKRLAETRSVCGRGKPAKWPCPANLSVRR